MQGGGFLQNPLNNGVPIHSPRFDLTIHTDASLRGWGATCEGQSIGGRWDQSESSLHINLLELKAAFLALCSFFPLRSPTPRHVNLLMDNTTAVAYINKKGGTHSFSLCSLALDLWAS